MSPSEIHLFKNYLSKSKLYFEYGCGGSTILADSYSNIESIVSVDSSIDWIEKIKEQTSKVSFFYVDINADSKNWGHPKDKSKIENWALYPSVILNQDKIFDLILVDGRFRIACCAAASIKMSEKSFLMLHDCERYPNIPLNKIDQVKSMGVYVKNDMSNEELMKVLEKFKQKCG